MSQSSVVCGELHSEPKDTVVKMSYTGSSLWGFSVMSTMKTDGAGNNFTN